MPTSVVHQIWVHVRATCSKPQGQDVAKKGKYAIPVKAQGRRLRLPGLSAYSFSRTLAHGAAGQPGPAPQLPPVPGSRTPTAPVASPRRSPRLRGSGAAGWSACSPALGSAKPRPRGSHPANPERAVPSPCPVWLHDPVAACKQLPAALRSKLLPARRNKLHERPRYPAPQGTAHGILWSMV